MDAELVGQLERGQRLGFLGPGPVVEHVAHAGAFVDALADVTGLVVDLGSGGGVPGLVVAAARPDLETLLVDSMDRRCAFLEDVVGILGLPRTRVVRSRAEDLGRSEVRGSVDAVMARSFGPPAVTAECAAPLLRLGGCLVVSEPPDATDRWPEAGLALLGLQLGRRLSAPAAIQTLVQVRDCPEEYPRRVGVPAKRPLF